MLTVVDKLLVVLDRLWEIKSVNAFDGDDEHRIGCASPYHCACLRSNVLRLSMVGRVVRRGKFGELRLVKFQEGFSCPTRATQWWG